VRKDDGAGLLLEREGEIEEVPDRAAAGAHERPAVADEVDALGGRERGLRGGEDGGVLLRGVGDAVVALAGGVGEDKGRAGWERKRFGLRGEDLADGLVVGLP